jgi:membrane AbrB-like protein
MDSGSAPRARKGIDFSSLRRNSRRVAETLLIGAIGGIIFDAVRFPAGWLAGAMVFCAGAALAGRPIGLPRPVARVFSVIVGMALGSVVSPAAMRGIGTWPTSIALLALAMVCVVVATMSYLRRVHGWDAMTALFAAYPGALAQVMTHAAEEDCDLRAVAFVQMIRVAMLTIGISAALAAFGLTAPVGPVAVKAAGLTEAPGEFAVLIASSVAVGLGLVRLGMPGGLLIGPMLVSAILHGSGLVSVTLPAWVRVAAMIGIGSVRRVALRRDRPTSRALPSARCARLLCHLVGHRRGVRRCGEPRRIKAGSRHRGRLFARRDRWDDGACACARSRSDLRRRPSSHPTVRPVVRIALHRAIGAQAMRQSGTATLTWINAPSSAIRPMSADPTQAH